MAGIDAIICILTTNKKSMNAFGKTIKLQLDGEIILLDGTTTPPLIHCDDFEADITASASIENFERILDSKMNVQMAMIPGKIKVQGDMIAAMPLMIKL